jgi:hypothetical protein
MSKDVTIYDQPEKEKKLWEHIQTCYRAAFLYKQGLGLHELWQTCEAYWSGDINHSTTEEDPGSEVNIVQPIIESQVADLVDGMIDFTIKGDEPTDTPYTDVARHILRWTLYHNDMVNTLDEFERERTNYGTCGFRVAYDPDAFGGKGKPTIDYVGVEELFPDPKVKDFRYLQQGDFFIRAIPYSLKALVQRFGDKARSVKAEGEFSSNDPRIFKDQDDSSGVDAVIRAQCLLFEFWEKDENSMLRRVYAAGGVILEDSFADEEEHKSFYKSGKYPYVIIPCYKKKGRLWGMGDTEQLIPVQDLINDLDDQIRMNARAMGNLQIVVGTGSGINLKKWTNLPGLRIPAKDENAWKPVVPYPIPNYVPQRRMQGFNEAELISGRYDVGEGRSSGSLRSAAAISQMAEAGSKRAKHKKLMLGEGFKQVAELVLDYVREFMDVERAFDFEDENKHPQSLWFRGTDLNNVPIKTLNENYNPTADGEVTDMYKTLLDDEGEEMTRPAEFIIQVTFGSGLMSSPSFLYQTTIELHRENIITQEEARIAMKTIMNYPIVDPLNPQGKFLGRNNSAEQLAMANEMSIPGQDPNQQQIPGQMQMPMPQGQMPEQGMDPISMLEAAVQQLPPQVLQQILGQLTGGVPGGIA